MKHDETQMAVPVDGRAERVVRYPGRHQLVLEWRDRVEILAAVRLGIGEFDGGEGIPLDEAEASLRRKHGFSR